MNHQRSALAGELSVMDTACSVARASRSLEVKTLAPVVHLVAWNSLPRKLWNFLIGMESMVKISRQKFLASSTFWGVNGYGELKGVEDNPNPGEGCCGTLALVWSCI